MSTRPTPKMLTSAAGFAGGAARGTLRLLDMILWSFIRLCRAVAITVIAAAACLAAVVAIATLEVSRALPDDSLALIDGRERGSITVFDKDGGFLGVRGQRFEPLTVEAAGPVLVDAILATEDRRFYWHLGVDPIGLARALLVNWRAGRTEQGGSSITQQVAKLAFLTNERSLSRKLRELPLSLALEWKYSKDEILEVYMNRAYLGGGAYGFSAASQFYFDKTPDNLTHAEAALLAGLLRAPSRWSPLNDFTAAQDRARVILDAMLDAERLDPTMHKAALDQVALMSPPQVLETAPYFVDWIADQIPDHLWEKAPDLFITTTLDTAAQTAAEDSVKRIFEKRMQRNQTAEAAVVVLSTDGAVRAMIGGRDYASSQFNRAASSARHLGSAFKPFVYAAALRRGLSLQSRVNDSPVTIRGWSPKNYANNYRGWISLPTALAKSSNVAAVRLAQHAGIRNVVRMTRRFGFASYVPAYPSLALGTIETNALEVAAAYAVFARDGEAQPAFGVSEIRNRDGDVIWSRRPPEGPRAISSQHARWMRAMMEEVVTQGTARRARIGELRVAGKTGTTQNYQDAWFAGFSDSYVSVVWMGRDDNKPMRRVTGGSFPTEIWRETMAALHGEEELFGAEDGPLAGLAQGEDGVGFGESDEPLTGAAIRNGTLSAERTRRREAARQAALARRSQAVEEARRRQVAARQRAQAAAGRRGTLAPRGVLRQREGRVLTRRRASSPQVLTRTNRRLQRRRPSWRD